MFNVLGLWDITTGRQTGNICLVFENGKCVYQSQKVMDIQAYCNKEKDTLWEEHKRNKNPHIVPVDLSEKLSALKSKLIEEMTVK